MELLSGEFFQCIPVMLQEIYFFVKLSILEFEFLDKIFLTRDGYPGLCPMDDCRTGADNPCKQKDGSRDKHEPCELMVLSVKYVFY